MNCPSCKNNYLFLKPFDNMGNVNVYYANCSCGTEIEVDKDKSGKVLSTRKIK